MTPKTKHILQLIFTITLIVILASYLIFSVCYFKKPNEKIPCKQVEICIEDSSKYRFTNELDIRNYLSKRKLNPSGKHIGIAVTNQIERSLREMNVCKKADCFMGYDSVFYIHLWQRCPLFRVIPNQGKSYYIDQDRQKMPVSNNFTAHLPILSGEIKTDAAQKHWFDFMLYLQNDKHWKNMIAEVHVDAQDKVILSSKQGIPYIELGTLQDYPAKMEKLRAWYAEFPHKNNDSIYQKISILYDQLIFCTKSK